MNDYTEYLKYEWVIARRAYAAICDYILYFAICASYIIIFGERISDGRWMTGRETDIVFIMLWLILFPVTESFKGRTIFKAIFKLRVIFEGENSSDRIVSTLLRRILDPIDLLFSFGIVAVIAVKVSKKHKRLGDFLGGTHVILENSSVGQLPNPM
ncbi:MAG: RDD family protein [Bacteroidota bacterium]